eukprot:1087727_1
MTPSRTLISLFYGLKLISHGHYLLGQLFGAIDEYGICGQSLTLNQRSRRGRCWIGGCCFTTLAGRIKYGITINNHNDQEDDMNDEEAIMQALKINEMVWESVCSVALQLYIATVFNQFNGTLIFSLATSF